MVKSKKGISPLIATVLIIGFTVALAAIIMTWGTKFTKDIQDTTSKSASANVACAQDVSLTVQNVCKLIPKSYKITISNDGTANIVSFKARLYQDANTAEVLNSGKSINSLGISTVTTSSITDFTTIQNVEPLEKVEIIPTIAGEGGTSVNCVQNIASFGDLGTDILTAC